MSKDSLTLWAWTLTTQDCAYDPYEWSGQNSFCSASDADRVFLSKEEAETHFGVWLREDAAEWLRCAADLEDVISSLIATGQAEADGDSYSLRIYTLSV